MKPTPPVPAGQNDRRVRKNARRRRTPVIQQIPSFVVKTSPIADEGLFGFLNRALSRTAITTLRHGLELAAVDIKNVETLGFINETEIAALATLFSVEADEIARRTNSTVVDLADTDMVHFHGVPIRKRFREATLRRVSPLALRSSPHHRAVWELRPLNFDLETLETLTDQCPVCLQKLDWYHSVGAWRCGRCRDDHGLPNVDLRDFPQPLQGSDGRTSFRYLFDLVSHDEQIRRAAAERAHPAWDVAQPWELFDLGVTLAGMLTLNAESWRGGWRGTPDGLRSLSPDALSTGADIILKGEPAFDAFADQMSRLAAENGVEMMSLRPVGAHLRRAGYSTGISEALRAWVVSSTAKGEKRRVAENIAELLPATQAAEEYRLPLPGLSNLISQNMISAFVSRDAVRLRLLRREEVAKVAADFHDAMHIWEAKQRTGLPAHVISQLAAGGNLKRVGRQVEVLKNGRAYVGKASLEALEKSLLRSADGHEAHLVPAAEAIPSLPYAAIPWSAVFTALLSMPRRSLDGTTEGWLQSIAIDPVELAEKVAHQLRLSPPAFRDDDMVDRVEAAEMLRQSPSFLTRLETAQLLLPTSPPDDTPRDPRSKFWRRGDILSFLQDFVFGRPLLELAGVSRWSDVRKALASRGFSPAFELERDLIYRRSDFGRAKDGPRP